MSGNGDYISRDVAIANSREYDLGGSYDNTERAVPVDAINSIHAADVRHVVLCRECKYSHPLMNNCKKCSYWSAHGIVVADNDFCSHGERRKSDI